MDTAEICQIYQYIYLFCPNAKCQVESETALIKKTEATSRISHCGAETVTSVPIPHVISPNCHKSFNEFLRCLVAHKWHHVPLDQLHGLLFASRPVARLFGGGFECPFHSPSPSPFPFPFPSPALPRLPSPSLPSPSLITARRSGGAL